MSDMVSGFPSIHSIETGLKRATKNRLVAQSTRFFFVSSPLELCSSVVNSSSLPYSFFASLHLSWESLPSEDHFLWTYFTCLSSVSPLGCSPEWSFWPLLCLWAPLICISPHFPILSEHFFCNDLHQTKPVQVTAPTKNFRFLPLPSG